MKTLVIIPAYNEQAAILDTVRDLNLHHPEIDVLAINNASIDANSGNCRRSSSYYERTSKWGKFNFAIKIYLLYDKGISGNIN